MVGEQDCAQLAEIVRRVFGRREDDRAFAERERKQRNAVAHSAFEPVGQVVGADSTNEFCEPVDGVQNGRTWD